MNPFISPPMVKGLFKNSVNMKKILNNIPSGVIFLDFDLNIIFFNRAAQSITGGVPEKSLGIPCRYFLRTGICLDESLIKHKDQPLENISVETDILNIDRQILPVRITYSQIFDEENKPKGFLLTLNDLRALKHVKKGVEADYSFSNIIGNSPKMEKIYRLLPVLAQSDTSILITGETGTGKDLLAEETHKASERSDGPFIKINCGALPETLLESELFGHTKGAFTGALENKPGRFKLAHNGTLFLTEVGDLPLTLQVKLLTFLDDKIVYPLGSTKGFQANVRIIAATHRNLTKMVTQGKFRQDLLFRLNVARLHIPPLRERDDDIFLLLNHFLKIFNINLKKNINGFTKEAKTLLLGYGYPGNVREIRNIVEYGVNICRRSKISPEDLPTYIITKTSKHIETKQNETMQQNEPTKKIIQNNINVNESTPESFSEIEKKLITNALFNTAGSKTKAASLLGWGRTTLWRKMKKYKIE